MKAEINQALTNNRSLRHREWLHWQNERIRELEKSLEYVLTFPYLETNDDIRAIKREVSKTLKGDSQ